MPLLISAHEVLGILEGLVLGRDRIEIKDQVYAAMRDIAQFSSRNPWSISYIISERQMY